MTTITFGAWFDLQAARGDAIGEIASAWKAATGSRPRLFAIKSVTSWVVSNADSFEGVSAPALMQLMESAAAEYRGTRPAYGQGEPEDPAAGLPPADPQARADGLLTGDSQADMDSAFRAATGKEPPPAVTQPSAAEILEAVDHGNGVLQRIEVMITQLWRAMGLDPNGQAGVLGMLGTLGERFEQHEQALAPLRAVLQEIADADDAADEADAQAEAEVREQGTASLSADLAGTPTGIGQVAPPEVTSQQGWAQPPPPYGWNPQAAQQLYGGHAVPSPSWAAIDEAVQPGDLGGQDEA